MAKLMISTQFRENYGAHDWDGTGECPQYWKSKGGEDYFVKMVKGTDDEATTLVMAVRSKIEFSNSAATEHIIDWKIVADDYVTEYERSQLKYDGRVIYPAKTITL